MTSNIETCTRKISVDISIFNAGLPKEYAGIWSHCDMPQELQSIVAKDIPFFDDRSFINYMQEHPRIMIVGAGIDDREQVAAAILKRTFSFNPTQYHPMRARFSDADSDMVLTRGMDGPAISGELGDYRTYVMLEIQNIDSKDDKAFRRLLWRRKDRYTIMTLDRNTSLTNVSPDTMHYLKQCERINIG